MIVAAFIVGLFAALYGMLYAAHRNEAAVDRLLYQWWAAPTAIIVGSAYCLASGLLLASLVRAALS